MDLCKPILLIRLVLQPCPHHQQYPCILAPCGGAARRDSTLHRGGAGEGWTDLFHIGSNKVHRYFYHCCDPGTVSQRTTASTITADCTSSSSKGLEAALHDHSGSVQLSVSTEVEIEISHEFIGTRHGLVRSQRTALPSASAGGISRLNIGWDRGLGTDSSSGLLELP